ncbi:hypothetical protein D3C80_1563770 [compost metagenome]
MGKASGCPDRGARTRGEGASHHGLGHQLRVVDWPGGRQRVASVVATIPETRGIHDRRIDIADMNVGKRRQFSAQRVGQATQAEFARRIGRCIGLRDPAPE